MARRPRSYPSRTVLVGDERVPVAVRESARARRARIVVRPPGLPEVVLPVGAPDTLVEALLAQHERWLHRALMRASAQADRAAALGLDRPGRVWLDGAALPVAVSSAAHASARVVAGTLRVGAPTRTAAVDAVARWYRREARSRIDTSVARESERLGHLPGPVSIRDQRTRWGSCARSGALSFNWRLAIAPPAALDYVVVHELCHLRRHDHSPAFWRLVADAMPDWEPRARWLKEHGSALFLYDPATAIATPTAP